MLGQPPQNRSSLRRHILAFVGGLILLSLAGSTISIFRITEVNRLLNSINRVSVPLGRLFAQMQSDAEVFQREFERSLGNSHWKDAHWKARKVPTWVEDVLESESDRFAELTRSERDWAIPESRGHWQEWAEGVAQRLRDLRADADRLFTALDTGDETTALTIYPRWTASMEEWRRQLQWGSAEYERSLRATFTLAETRVAELRTGLELILGIVVLLSLLLMWLGERALRPLAELTRLTREITRRGLRKEDKAMLPEFSLNRDDEVSTLAREFHRMATVLLEREKTVELQKSRLQENNRMLREMGQLNETVLNSINSILIVADLEHRITQLNPVAARWLGDDSAKILGTLLSDWAKLERFAIDFTSQSIVKIEPSQVAGRIFGGHLMPLRQSSEGGRGSEGGIILVLDDLTEDLEIQERLRQAENLAAVGRMSAQVAHEVRNPLHSIGLEAEMAVEMASLLGNVQLKQSLQSILAGVDRLDKITENYLKLSRLSAGRKTEVDLGEVLESVLATYTAVCEAKRIRVDWKHDAGGPLLVMADRDLLEQGLGNLMRNSIQAFEGQTFASPRIVWAMGRSENGRVWLRIEDNGPGIAPEIRDRLFVPFATTRAQGTGLGLSFIKKVLEDHGGSIVSLDRAPGCGASFELEIGAFVPGQLTLPGPPAPPKFSEESPHV